MTESHVLSALKEKRAELAGDLIAAEKRIPQLRTDMAHLDHTMRLFDTEAAPHRIRPIARRKRSPVFAKGEFTRAILNTLRTTERPMTAVEIAESLANTHGIDIVKPTNWKSFLRKVNVALAGQRPKTVTSETVGDAIVWRTV